MKREQKRRKKSSSTASVECDSLTKESVHSSTDNHNETDDSDSLIDSGKCSSESMALPESLPSEASILEETLESRVQKYIELDMKTHIDFIQVKQTLPQDMEGLEYLMYLYL